MGDNLFAGCSFTVDQWIETEKEENNLCFKNEGAFMEYLECF